MFVPSWFKKTSLALAILLIGAAAGCQKHADPDSQAEATAKTKQVTVDVTGMS